MYLSLLKISNFRCFDESEHIIGFNPCLTILVGENDSGKSAIIDAIRKTFTVVSNCPQHFWIA